LNTWIISPRRCLKSSDDNLRTYNVSPCGRCFRCVVNLVAPICIFSICNLSIRCRGCHIIFPYIRWGLTRVVNNLGRVSWSTQERVNLMSPSNLLALFTA
jgi:hypothetical protein